MGRGSGQIQMSTRSGTNELHGSLFWTNRNSKLAANSWNNNFQGVGKDYYNGNQFGGRIGGPIIKNKTFFFFLFDGQRYLTKSYFTGAVLTDQARDGIFRFFPGVQNGNALSNSPTVDRNGNPILNGQPATPQSINVFGRDVNGAFTPWDPARTGLDQSGWIKTLLGRMPRCRAGHVNRGLCRWREVVRNIGLLINIVKFLFFCKLFPCCWLPLPGAGRALCVRLLASTRFPPRGPLRLNASSGCQPRPARNPALIHQSTNPLIQCAARLCG